MTLFLSRIPKIINVKVLIIRFFPKAYVGVKLCEAM